MAQLICNDVTLGYDGKAVTEHLSFQVNKGDYLCIVGENGAGKSTLIKALLFNSHTIAKVRNSTFSKARVPLGTNISAICFNPDSSTFFEYKVQKGFLAFIQLESTQKTHFRINQSCYNKVRK